MINNFFNNKSRSIFFFLLLLFTAFFKPSILFAFGENYGEMGFKKNKTYLRFSPQEFVNVFSGNLLLTHTDINLPGNGGFDLKLQRTYNSKLFAGFTIINNPTIAGLTLGSFGLGWDMHFGRISDYGLTVVNDPNEFFLQLPDGSIHPIYNNNHPIITSHVSSTYITEDFWITNYDLANDRYTMSLTDGTEYTFSRRVTNGFSYSFLYVTSIRDKNGNEITIEYYDCCNMTDSNPDTGTIGTCPDPTNVATHTRHIKKVTDSVGREVNFTMLNTMCRGNAISSIDFNGDTYNYLYFPGDDRPSTPWLHWDGGSGRLLAEVQPPVGPSWQYFYDVDPNDTEPDGELISVTYPSGGVAQYDYETVVLNLLISSSVTSPVQFRMITSRTTSGPAISPGTWTFNYDPANLQDIATITDSCGNKEAYNFFGLREGSFNGGWSIGLLNNKEIRDTTNFIFQSKTNNWTPYQISNDGIDPISSTTGIFLPLIDRETINRDGIDYITDFTYNRFYDSPTQITETCELLRTTDITYFEDLAAGNYIIGKPLATTVTVDTESKTITNTYDSKGNLLSEDEYGVLTAFSYHPDGNLQWEKNTRGFHTHFDQYSLGAAGRIRFGSSTDTATDPVYAESRTINPRGTIANLTNGRGHINSFGYDSLNRLTSITPPPSGEAQTTIEYDNLSARSMIIRKGDSFVQHFLDGFGRLIGTLSTTGVQTEIDYDGCGRKVYQSLPFNSITPNVGESFTYDPLGRIKSMTHPDNTKMDFSYTGNSVTIKNERNISTTLNYKSFGDPDEKRLSSVLDAHNNTTSYEYDLLGNITRVNTPLGSDRVFTYNSKYFLISETHPESGTTMFGYDEIGNVTSKTNADGKSIGFQYDRLNRLTSIEHPQGEDDVAFAYDDANNRTMMESSSGSYSYTYQYDQSNRLTRQDVSLGGFSYSVDFIYDEKNNLMQEIYPSGETVNYNYDAGNRILHISPVAGNFSYHPSGAPTHFDNEIGVSSDFTYDDRNRLKTLQISRTFPYLLVNKDGLGGGTVTSNPLGIDCGSDCALISGAEGIAVTLTATPDQGSNFVSWGGDPDCTDGTVTMIGTKVCIATFALKSNQETLTVTKDGSGAGTLTSSPPGIDCGSDCSENYDVNTLVTLTATPDAGFSFNGWSGDPDCSDGMVAMDASKTCNATFGLQQFTLNVANLSDGFGSGTITSSPAGISCGGDCSEVYDENTRVTLTPMPHPGSQFGSWSGVTDCLDGMVTMDSDKSCGATFVKFFTLTIQKNGTGRGTVTSNPPGINCGTDCSEAYGVNSIVSFNITPDPGSKFVGWSGPSGCPTSPTSSALMVSNLACTATFDLLPLNQFSLNITKDGTAGGTVTSDPFGIKCGGDCMEVYDEGTSVTLTTNPGSGAVFSGWSGDPDCSDGNVLMDANKTCNATFDDSSEVFTLTVDIIGFGRVIALKGALSGGVGCTKMGILGSVAGSDCTETHPINTDLTLVVNTLSPCPPGFMQFCTNPEFDYNSTFIRWEGDPDCSDQEIMMDSDKTCIGIFTPYLLTLSASGSGTVSRTPLGNTCTGHPNCDKYYEPGTVVGFTVNPNAGNYFSGWTGDADCSDSSVTMYEKKSCTANFDALPPNSVALTVLKSGTGTGTVTSSDAGINCGADCLESYAANTLVTLTPSPDPGSVFVGWSGDPDCSGNVVTMDGGKICTAQFDLSFDLTQPSVYVANTDGDSLSVIDPLTNTEVANTSDVRDAPYGVAVSPDGTRVYITNISSDALSVINAENLELVDRVQIGDKPNFLTTSADGTRIYVANENDNTVSVIDTSNNTLVDTASVSSGPLDVATHPLGGNYYVTISLIDIVYVMDSFDNSFIDNIVVGDGPQQIAMSPDGALAYVSNFNDNTISVIDTTSNTVIDTLNVGDGPYGIAVSPDGINLYVTNKLDDTISVIDTTSNSVVDTVNVGVSPVGIAVSSDGANVYVTNELGNTVSVIETLNNTVIQTVVVGDRPVGIAFRPGNDPSPPQQHTLSISKSGPDTGTVTSSPVGIDCGADCAEDYDEDTFVTLTAIPDPNSIFAGWSGDPDCTNGVVRMSASKNCIANFNITQFNLTISKTGTGGGVVTSGPAGLDCGADCTEDYIVGTNVTVIATPDPGSTFDGWSGDCDVNGMVTMDAAKSCTVTFTASSQLITLSVSKSGTGIGTVTSSPAGIACGIDCTEDYAMNSQVTLTPTPDAASVFIGWSGDPDCSDGLVLMAAARSCNAVFDAVCNCSAPNAIVGTGGNDSLQGTSGSDIICGLNGSDTLLGQGGGDCLYGGTGIDTLQGGRGSDKLYGGADNDTLQGEDGNDLLDGGSGTDNLDGGKNTDTCINGETLANCESSQIQHTLTVNKNGTGAGTVTSNPTGINCGSDCTESYNSNTQVTLTATPDPGSNFSSWSGDADCSDGVVTMNSSKSCTATFDSVPVQQFMLTVNKSGTGTGTVTSNPTGINCGSDCTENYAANSQVTLAGTPASGSTFIGWSGDADCTDGLVTMDANKTCTGIFDVQPQDPCDCNAPNAIVGTSGNNTLNGTSQSDIICGLDGDDTLIGRGGNDCLVGGTGIDTLQGGKGADKLYGGVDNDTLKGEDGNDLLDGGNGTDNLNGGKNTDTCLNGEITSNCEQFSSLNEIKSKSNRIEVIAQKEDKFKTMLTFKSKSAEKNYQNSSMLGRMSSYIHSLRLMLISVLFATNAYAQFSPTAFIDIEYFYDGVGNVASIIDHIDSANSCTMQYDSLDRLTVADGAWGAGSFSFDSIGNRTSKDINGQNIAYTYGSSDNRLGGVTHDANGNIIDDGIFTYIYDSEDRLIQVTNGTEVISYGYDGDGRRISQTINGETTFFGYGVGLNVLTEFSGSGVPKFDYIYAGSRNIARINFDAAGVPVNKTFYHGDHLGSTIGLTDQETTVVWNRMYLPYGGTFTGTGAMQNTHQYTAKELDEDTGLYYYGARYYNPSIGRFMSVDPAGGDLTDPQSWNRYAYVLNNPFKYIDPDGESAVDLSGIAKVNTQLRSKLGFVPSLILDLLLPVEPEAIVSSSLPGPQALGMGTISKGVGNAITKAVNNPVPKRVARVVDKRVIDRGATRLGAPDAEDVFVTAADDVMGIQSSEALAERLTLLNKAGELRRGPFAVIEFDTPSGIASPIFRTNPGFVGFGRTARGAREFVVPNLTLEELINTTIRTVP